jgi:L-lactate dehydrogenase (cytochrome)
MRLTHCCNYHDFRELARRRLPGPIFDYIDGAATMKRPTKKYARSKNAILLNVLAGVAQVDLSVTVMGQNLRCPLLLADSLAAAVSSPRRARCRPRRRKVRHDVRRFIAGDCQPGRNFDFLVSAALSVYFHKDRGLNNAMMERAKSAGVRIMMLTVDSITGAIVSAIFVPDFLFHSG